MKINKESRNFSISFLNQIGFKSEITLPLIDKISIKSIQKIGERIIQLYALIGLSLTNINSDKIMQWLVNHNLYNNLSEEEQNYFQKYKNSELTKKETISLDWLRECLYTLMWCSEIISELPYPKEESELEKYISLIPPKIEITEFMQKIKIRNQSEIIKQADLHYCLHWLIRSNLSKNLDLNFQPKIDVVVERRKSLEWVISHENWDDITLDT